jgi:ABC-type glycerol-3-phosphate transport system substrate-binding protein
MPNISLTRRQSLALGAASLFTLGSKGVNAQGQAELTFWSVRLNTPELQEALLPLLDQFMAENPGIKITNEPVSGN